MGCSIEVFPIGKFYIVHGFMAVFLVVSANIFWLAIPYLLPNSNLFVIEVSCHREDLTW